MPHIHTKGFQLAQDEQDLIVEKVDHLRTYDAMLQKESATINLDLTREPNENHIYAKVVIHVANPKATLVAEAHAPTALSATEGTITKLKPQIERHKSHHANQIHQ